MLRMFVKTVSVPFIFTVIIMLLQRNGTVKVALSESRILRAQVLSMGTVSRSSMTSLALTTPAMRMALLDHAVIEYDGRLNFTLTLLYNSSILDEQEMPFYSDEMLSRWFYETRTEEYNVTVIVVPGKILF
jgi:hypothetical protein